MWGALGDLQFTLLGGPVEFQDKQEADWAEHPIVGGKTRLQMTGLKAEELTLRIRLHPFLTSNPDLDLRSLLDSMRQGDPQDLVIGNQDSGIYAGKFVIASVEHDRVDQWPDGRIRLAEVTLNLKEWTTAPGLQVSARKTPPAAIRKAGQGASPSTQTKVQRDKGSYGGAR